jgi:signal transduction histidine kinase
MQPGYRVRLTKSASHPGDGCRYTVRWTAGHRLAGHNGQVNLEWRGTAREWLGRALAFARSADPQPAVPGRAIAGDVALAAAFLLVSLFEVAALGHSGSLRFDLVPPLSSGGAFQPQVRTLLPHAAGSGWPAAVASVATSAPLAGRRAYPLATFWVLLGATAIASHYAVLATFVAIVFAAYNAVTHSRFRGAALLSLPVAAAAITAAFPNTSPPIPARATPFAIMIPIAIVGNAVRVWRRRAGDSQDRLHRLAAEHAEATRRALEVERARIASELHDVVTHNVSVMVVQAGAARRVLDDAPGEARTAMLAVESSGRAAMTELRHLLGLLGPPGTWDGPAPAGAAGTLSPQPGLGQLRSLIDPVVAAGLPVELQVTGAHHDLPPGLDLAAFRIVQEALTNVIKHAGRARAQVKVDYRPTELALDIADDGPAASAGAPGRGLLGLRERVALYGGELDAGPRPGGGWRVRARIPIDTQPAGQA